MVSVKLLAAFISMVPLVSSFTLEALKKTPEYEKLSLLPSKYPVITNFVNNAITRHQEKRFPYPIDVYRLQVLLDALQNEFVEFVSGPKFAEYAAIVKQQIKIAALPVLAAVPMDEIERFVDSIEQNTELQDSLAQDVKDFSEIVLNFITEERIELLKLEALKLEDIFVNGARSLVKRITSPDFDFDYE